VVLGEGTKSGRNDHPGEAENTSKAWRGTRRWASLGKGGKDRLEGRSRKSKGGDRIVLTSSGSGGREIEKKGKKISRFPWAKKRLVPLLQKKPAQKSKGGRKEGRACEGVRLLTFSWKKDFATRRKIEGGISNGVF